MRVKCYSVRLKSLTRISDKCNLAEDWQGNKDLIPESQIFGQDWEVLKSDAYWISCWILEKKKISFSIKKCAWIDNDNFKVYPNIEVAHHIPKEIEPIKRNIDEFIR